MVQWLLYVLPCSKFKSSYSSSPHYVLNFLAQFSQHNISRERQAFPYILQQNCFQKYDIAIRMSASSLISVTCHFITVAQFPNSNIERQQTDSFKNFQSEGSLAPWFYKAFKGNQWNVSNITKRNTHTHTDTDTVKKLPGLCHGSSYCWIF